MSSYTNQSMAHPPRRKSRTKMDPVTLGLLIAFIVLGIVLAIVAGKFVFNLVKSWSMTDLPGAPVESSNEVVVSTESPLQQSSSSGVTSKPWDGNSRINILLMGLDHSSERETTEPGPAKTDTMILVTVDPLSKTIGALSIRRDLWVNIPGYDYNKINMAYFYGVANNIPGGGPGLAMKTVEEFLGVPIDYYAQVDFDSFVALIDEIGGVKMDIPERILLDPMGNEPPVWVESGVQTLPGYLALAYARNRHTDGGDVDRGNRQMQVIMAIRDRIFEFDMLPKLIIKAPTLYNQVSKGIQTNLTLDQIIQLGTLMMNMPRENINTYVIDYSQTTQEMVNGLDVLRPIPDQIRLLRDKMFAENSGATAPLVVGSSDALQLAKAENARIEVLNGTSTGGVADTTAEYLRAQGLNVVSTGNANENYLYTTLVLHNASPYTLSYLSTLMNVPSTRIYQKLDTSGQSDVTIYIGSDWTGAPAQ